MIIYSENTVKRKLPVNFKETDKCLFEKEFEKKIPFTELKEFKNIKVNSDLILFRNGKILPESLYPYFKDPTLVGRVRFLIKNDLLKKVKKIDKTCIWVIDRWSISYFHWLTDAIPRLYSVKEKINNSVVILPYQYKKFEFITSSLLPFEVKDLRFINQNEVFSIKNLLFPTHTAPTGNYNEQIIQNIRDIFIEFFENKNSLDLGDKIYISRAKAPTRKILNENEIEPVLKEYGFKIVFFEDHSFQEQVNIALKTKYMVSIHGAGLTNMLFMRPGCSVFEIRRRGDTHNNCYFSLASALGLNYFYQTCETQNSSTKINTASLIIDKNLFRENLEIMLMNEENER